MQIDLNFAVVLVFMLEVVHNVAGDQDQKQDTATKGRHKPQYGKQVVAAD